jgi:signal transduction histidine kinase
LIQTETPISSPLPRILAPADAKGGLLVRQLRTRSVEVAANGLEPVKRVRPRERQEGPSLLPVERNVTQSRAPVTAEVPHQESLGIPLIPLSVAPGSAAEMTDLKQSVTDIALNDSLDSLIKPAGLPLQQQTTKKGRKLARVQLAQKVEELARSNAELEQFAYVTSHDLQEPLRMIANYTQLLAERYNGKLDAQADKYIHYAVEGALRMQTLIQDLLAFSRAGGGAGNGLKIIDCKNLVEQALKNLHVAIQDSGAVVICDDLPVVMARPLQLVQVFQNLIGNAIKFRGIEPPVVQISVQKEGTEWVFSVTDNGIAIAPENAKIIFAIFQRLHSRTEYPGNGIGLAICKKIVEQQGGRIWLEPHTEPGATFRFSWPALLHHVKKEQPHESHD